MNTKSLLCQLKKIAVVCLFFLCVLETGKSRAQASLGFSGFIQMCGDTVEYGDYYDGQASLKNFGNATYDGTMKLYYSVNGVTQPDEIFSTHLHNFSPGDYSPVLINFSVLSSRNFDVGDNIVVIWPVALGALTHDSLKTHVVVPVMSGVSSIPKNNTTLTTYTDGSRVYFQYLNPDFETKNIVITDLTGRELMIIRDQNPASFPIGDLPAGIYVVMVTSQDNQQYIFRIIKP